MRIPWGRKLEMAARVRVFSLAHPSEDAGYVKTLAEFEERLARAEMIAGTQVDEEGAETSARSRRNEIRKVVHFTLLRYLVEVGVVAAKDRAELASRFKLPSANASHRGFSSAVRSMLTVATSQKASMVAAGMAPSLLDDLGRMLTEFDLVSNVARTARLGHVTAVAELETIVKKLMKLVRLLDGINRWRFGDHSELLVAWNTAKRATVRSRRAVAPSAGDGGVTPAGSGGVVPAA